MFPPTWGCFETIQGLLKHCGVLAPHFVEIQRAAADYFQRHVLQQLKVHNLPQNIQNRFIISKDVFRCQDVSRLHRIQHRCLPHSHNLRPQSRHGTTPPPTARLPPNPPYLAQNSFRAHLILHRDPHGPPRLREVLQAPLFRV